VFDPQLAVAELSEFYYTLGTMAGWLLRTSTVEHNGQSYSLLGLGLDVGFDQGIRTLSEVVGFAPFEYLPLTRRAPVPAIAFRAKPANSLKPLQGRAERRANLAAIQAHIPANTFSRLWEMSEKLREELDGKTNPIARARVAFAFLADESPARQGSR
jgi:hypothetical protein